MIKANLVERQKVDIINLETGKMFSTYIIAGEKGEIVINGTGTKKASKGDKIMIIAYSSISIDEADDFFTTIVFLNNNNEILKEMPEDEPVKKHFQKHFRIK